MRKTPAPIATSFAHYTPVLGGETMTRRISGHQPGDLQWLIVNTFPDFPDGRLIVRFAKPVLICLPNLVMMTASLDKTT
jgi:hypothetical protein